MPREKKNTGIMDLVSIGRALSGTRSLSEMFRKILLVAQENASADGGSLYILNENRRTLEAVLVSNTVLGIEMVKDDFNPLFLEGVLSSPLDENESGHLNISAAACADKKTVYIRDLDGEDATGFDVDRVRSFDKEHGYKTKSILTVPLISPDAAPIGAVQLINPGAGEILSDDHVAFVEALAGQAGIILHNGILTAASDQLLNSVVEMVSTAIDEKSPHTAGHCMRVTDLFLMFAEEVSCVAEEPFGGFEMTELDRRELEMAGLLHDVGKIVTPQHVLDKETKLSCVTDRIKLIEERLNVARFSEENEALRRRIKSLGVDPDSDGECCSAAKAASDRARDDLDFLSKVNTGEIFMDADAEAKLNAIAERKLADGDPLLTQEEVLNLSIKRGTLNDEERKIIEGHVSSSIRLLESITWPNSLRRIPEYAGGHHERIDGAGYPNGLTGDQMSLPAKMLAIADRFESLTAPDRPYKKVMTLARALDIMDSMNENQEIDSGLYKLFRDRKIYMRYARRHIPEERIDCD